MQSKHAIKTKKIKHEYEYEINTCHGCNKYHPCIPDLLGQIQIRSSLFKGYKVQRQIQRKTKELTESQPQKH